MLFFIFQEKFFINKKPLKKCIALIKNTFTQKPQNANYEKLSEILDRLEWNFIIDSHNR